MPRRPRASRKRPSSSSSCRISRVVQVRQVRRVGRRERPATEARLLELLGRAVHGAVVGAHQQVPVELRRRVVAVDVVVVEEQEERFLARLVEPAQGPLVHLRCRRFAIPVGDEVEGIEPAREAAPRTEQEGVDDGGRRVAVSVQPRRDRVGAFGKLLHASGHAVRLGSQPGQERDVRRDRPRARSRGVLEHHAAGGEGVEGGRGGARVPIRSQPVLPERVDRDQDEVARPLSDPEEQGGTRRDGAQQESEQGHAAHRRESLARRVGPRRSGATSEPRLARAEAAAALSRHAASSTFWRRCTRLGGKGRCSPTRSSRT